MKLGFHHGLDGLRRLVRAGRLPARVLEESGGLGVERREPRVGGVLVGGFDEVTIRIRGFGL